jgi:hypothetical protein
MQCEKSFIIVKKIAGTRMWMSAMGTLDVTMYKIKRCMWWNGTQIER